jgi:hypothetical protein
VIVFANISSIVPYEITENNSTEAKSPRKALQILQIKRTIAIIKKGWMLLTLRKYLKAGEKPMIIITLIRAIRTLNFKVNILICLKVCPADLPETAILVTAEYKVQSGRENARRSPYKILYSA